MAFELTINNVDGAGSANYAESLLTEPLLTLKRVLNQPSSLTFSLLLDPATSTVPQRFGRVLLASDAGILFTGYVVGEPVQRGIGIDNGQAIYALDLTAISDEVVLDSMWSTSQIISLGQSSQQTWQVLSALAGNSVSSLQLGTETAAAGRLEIDAGASWSAASAELANNTRSAYRVLNGVVTVTPVGSVAHDPSGESLAHSNISLNALKLLATDFTVCGQIEPTAYVTEIFQGDGVTTDFSLTSPLFTLPSTQRSLIQDLFEGTALNPQLWRVSDPSAHLALEAGGLTCNGGSGRDAETSVSSLQQIEMGGLITAEAHGVSISAGSTGIVIGFFSGGISQADCFFGFQASQQNGNTQLDILVNGLNSGGSFQPEEGHLYTLRLRAYSPEVERVRQTYDSLGITGVETFGGNIVAASGRLEAEIQDVTSGLPTAPTVLYQGDVSSLPAACNLGLLESGALSCSIKSVLCARTEPLWVGVGATATALVDQYTGTTADGASCTIRSTGALKFYPSAIPQSNAFIQVSYRAKGRAVARRAFSSGSSNGTSETQTFIGTVVGPSAWSSVDCDNAVQALLNASATGNGAFEGTWKFQQAAQVPDIWPGDVLQISSGAGAPSFGVVIRDVEIQALHSAPEVFSYTVRLANDWAEDLAIRLSGEIPSDAVLPQQPTTISSALGSLSALQVANVTGSTVTLSMGAAAPVNGGFEIRRRDNTFGPGTDSDLVLRASTSNIAIPRLAAIEQYYVRMYDGANPPNYSLYSAAVFLNVPL